MSTKILIPIKNAVDVYTMIKFSKKPIIEMVESGTHNTKARTKYYLKTIFTPTSNGYSVEEFEKGEKTPRDVFLLTEGECKYLIWETLHEYEVGNIIGDVKIYEIIKDLKGIKTAVWGKKSHRNDVVKYLENSVRRMF